MLEAPCHSTSAEGLDRATDDREFRKRYCGADATPAQFVQTQARFVAHLEEDRLRFSRIERDLEDIKSLLITRTRKFFRNFWKQFAT